MTHARRFTRFAMIALGFTLLVLRGSSACATTYLDYYRSITKAEEAVVNGQYHDAINLYKAGFAAHAFSYPVDCYVAAQVASYSGDTQSCISFIRRGICSGLPLQTIRGNPHLSPFISEGQSGAVSGAVADSCWQVYLGRIDHKARAIMIGLIRRDQGFLRSLPRKESIYTRDGILLKPVYQPLWDSLLREIIRVTKESGFPAEQVVGTQNGDDSMLAIRPHALFAYYIMIHHRNAWPQIGSMLRAELEKGNITPQMYGALADYSAAKAQLPQRYMALRDCEAFLNSGDCRESLRGRMQELNAARSEIGLCSYEVMQKKRAGTAAYYKWRRGKSRTPKPLFDFESELHSFQE